MAENLSPVADIADFVDDVLDDILIPGAVEDVILNFITAGAYDPTIGNSADVWTPITVPAIVRGFTLLEIEAGLGKILAGDRRVTIKLTPDTSPVTNRDTIEIDGDLYKIADVKRRDLVGIITLQARR